MMCFYFRRLANAVCLWALCILPGHAQVHLSDSLTQVLNHHPASDTGRVNILTDLSLKEFRHVPDKAKLHAQQALDLAQQLGFEKGIGWAYDALSRHAYIIGEYQTAADYGFKMLPVFEKLKSKKGIAAAYSNIGGAYTNMKDHAQAGLYLRKAIALYRETGSEPELLYTYNRYGLMLYNKGQFDSALIIHKRVLAMREARHDNNGIAQSCNNIGIALVDMQRLDEAAPYFTRALKYFETQHDTLRVGGVCQNLGNLYLQKRDFTRSEYYLKHALAMAQAFGSAFELNSAYGFLADLEEARGNYKQALAHYKQLLPLRDTLYNEDKTNVLAEAETRYETEKKEQTIKLLEKENQIQNIWHYLLVCGVLLIGVVYLLQRSRTKRIREWLESQEILNAKLKETDLMKSRFFANISHEFRTPLSLIIAPIEERLRSPNIEAQDKAGLQLAIRNANRLLSLVNQLLDLSKLEAGKAELNLAGGNLKKFLRMLAASFESLAASKRIQFKQVDSLPDRMVNFDADKIEKILTNILFNAFKFTPAEGVVMLEVFAPDDESLMMRITDTGKGIPEEDQPYIFSPFYQSRHTQDDGQPGTGLGLALADEMLKIYKGNVALSSTVHEGTIITVVIPVQWNETVADPINEMADYRPNGQLPEPSLQPSALDIASGEDETTGLLLVVEDNRDLREFIVSVFREQFSVITAVDGETGLAAAIEHIPDMIISDVMMPVMDGVAMVDRIKTDARTSHIPVVLLTAKADAGSRMQGLKNGADDYLSKPFSVEELRVRIDNLIDIRRKLVAKFTTQIATMPGDRAPESLDEKFIWKVKDLIEAHIGDADFGVELLASEMFMSRSQLFRKFKALMDTSPSEYVNDLRLEKAKKLIAARADTVSQISYAVGFKDQSYFAKRFRKKYGKSPSEYADSV